MEILGAKLLESEIFDYLDEDDCIFKQAPLEKLAEEGAAYELSPSWLLAVYGHHAGENPVRKPLEPWQSSMECLGQVRKI